MTDVPEVDVELPPVSGYISEGDFSAET